MPVKNLKSFSDSIVNDRMIKELEEYNIRQSAKEKSKKSTNTPKVVINKPKIVTDWTPYKLYSYENVSNKVQYPTSVNNSNNNSNKQTTKETKEVKENKETREIKESIEVEEFINPVKNFIYGLGQTANSAYHKYFQSENNYNISDTFTEDFIKNTKKLNKLELKDIEYWNEKEKKDRIKQLSDSIRNNIISLGIPTFKNSIGFASGIATPNNRFFTTDRGQWINQKGYNIAAPWNDWVDAEKAYSNPSLIRNSYFNRYLPEGQYPTYIVVDNEGKMNISDTIPNIKGKITTGYYTKGKRIVPGSWKHETGNNAWQFMTGDSIPSSPNSAISSYTYNKNNLDNLNNPVVNMVVGNLPNGEQTWIMPYGRTHNQFVKDVNDFSSAFGEERPDLKFVSFDAGRNRYSIMDNTPRIYTGFGNFPNLLLKYRYGGRKSLKNI